MAAPLPSTAEAPFASDESGGRSETAACAVEGTGIRFAFGRWAERKVWHWARAWKEEDKTRQVSI